MKRHLAGILMTLLSLQSLHALAQTNRIDIIRPDAPELAAYGSYAVGVRTLELLDPGRIDVLGTERGAANASYDRPLTVEVWYPAQLAANQQTGTEYLAITRDPSITARLHGRAVRDAEPLRDNRYPLIIISHGYPGNRFLLSHLGENLASKGYVTVSIDHTDSTYDDQQAFASTLYNRPLDQLFVLDTMAKLAATGSGSFLSQLVDIEQTGLIGFSMGGYGALNNLGAGFSEAAVNNIAGPPNRLLQARAATNPDYRQGLDARIKAGLLIAPWGMNTGFWDEQGLLGVSKPIFFVAGDADVTAGYENGTRAIFTGTQNSDRYLLTFANAGHSVAAPIPMPIEILSSDTPAVAGHYLDSVWDSVRTNNILNHFATAFFALHLKQESESDRYLQDIEQGFTRGGTLGLRLEHGPSAR
ncbi:MAG: dienelactone hydrolase [Pseudomonadales bacterium]|nr:dienelactone hydrolase [Pseudomonadales bacterium]